MNTSVLTETLPNVSIVPFYFMGRFNTNSSQIQDRDIAKLSEDYLEESFLTLEQELGPDLFKELSLKEKAFIVETAGSIDLGKPVDLEEVSIDIANYEY